MQVALLIRIPISFCGQRYATYCRHHMPLLQLHGYAYVQFGEVEGNDAIREGAAEFGWKEHKEDLWKDKGNVVIQFRDANNMYIIRFVYCTNLEQWYLNVMLSRQKSAQAMCFTQHSCLVSQTIYAPSSSAASQVAKHESHVFMLQCHSSGNVSGEMLAGSFLHFPQLQVANDCQ